jgi:phosphate transport system protein
MRSAPKTGLPRSIKNSVRVAKSTPNTLWGRLFDQGCGAEIIYIPFTFGFYLSCLRISRILSRSVVRTMVRKKQSVPARSKRRSALVRPVASRELAVELENRSDGSDDDELTTLIVRGCLIARDAVFNVKDFLAEGSRLALLAIKDCEKELDQIERKIDEQLPEAITRVGEAKARELLACLKFITDLERIGDLAYSAVMQLQSRREKLPAADARQLIEMASLLREMLEQIHQGFVKREVTYAQSVLKSDPEVDRLCHSLFHRHLAEPNSPTGQKNFDILLAAQALERIGDHAKNLAEELYGLCEGRSLRHNSRKLSTA